MAQTFAFLVAGTVFVASMGAILYTTNTIESDTSSPEEAALQGQARSILDMLTGSPGVGMDQGPDDFTRFGLLDDDRKGVSHDFMQHLCGPAKQTDPTDGRIDYGSVTRSIGLDPDDGTQFHLRIRPAEVPYTDFSEWKTAYVGQINPVQELEQPNIGIPDPLNPPDSPLETFVSKLESQYGDVESAYRRPGAAIDPTGANQTYVQQLNSHFTASALSEKETISKTGVKHKPMPDAYGSSVEGTVTYKEEILGVEVETTVPASTLYPEDLLHGDIYFDHKPYLNETLAQRMDDYELIIIGSHVDHSQLTPLKEPLVDWVLDGGIVLIMGSADGDAKVAQPVWIQDLFAAGTQVADTGPYRPASTHPLFNSFWHLSANDFKGSQPFMIHDEHIMERVVPADGGKTHVAASRCGALGDGLLARLSYTEADEITYDEYAAINHQMTAASAACRHQGAMVNAENNPVNANVTNYCVEFSSADVDFAASSLALLQNLIAYGNLQALYVDLGPPIPQKEAVAHQMRIISYDHPIHGAMSIEAHVYTWIE